MVLPLHVVAGDGELWLGTHMQEGIEEEEKTGRERTMEWEWEKGSRRERRKWEMN